MHNFKVGDRVQFTDEESNQTYRAGQFPNSNKNTIFTVRKADSNFVWLNCEEHQSLVVTHEDHVKIYVESHNGFTIGDLFRRSHYEEGTDEYNEIHTVTDFHYKYDGDSTTANGIYGSDGLWTYFGNVEKVDEKDLKTDVSRLKEYIVVSKNDNTQEYVILFDVPSSRQNREYIEKAASDFAKDNPGKDYFVMEVKKVFRAEEPVVNSFDI